MSKQNYSILFLGKENNNHTNKAAEFCLQNFNNVICNFGKWGDPLPDHIINWQGDFIISYLSRWIISEQLLNTAKIAAINFHPASPEYPGFGCNNFALFEEAKEFGVTCHYMAPKIDTGKIIAVKRFPIFETDNIDTLLHRTYAYQLILFYDVMSHIIKYSQLPTSDEKWSRQPFTKKKLDNLMLLSKDMSKKEMSKIIRATTFNNWKPTIEINGFVFKLKTD